MGKFGSGQGLLPHQFPWWSRAFPVLVLFLKDTSLREVLKSNLFTTLRSGEMLTCEHSSVCVLFEQRESVEAILKEETVNASY